MATYVSVLLMLVFTSLHRKKEKLTDGIVFDSNFERGDPIEFELGSGQMIKGS